MNYSTPSAFIMKGARATSFLYTNHWIENVLDILHDWQIFKIIAHARSKHNILSATSGISESIIGAEEGGEGAGDGVAVGGDGGGGRHPVVQHPHLSTFLLVLLQAIRPNFHLEIVSKGIKFNIF